MELRRALALGGRGLSESLTGLELESPYSAACRGVNASAMKKDEKRIGKSVIMPGLEGRTQRACNPGHYPTHAPRTH